MRTGETLTLEYYDMASFTPELTPLSPLERIPRLMRK
jgi:hypothetical protein